MHASVENVTLRSDISVKVDQNKIACNDSKTSLSSHPRVCLSYEKKNKKLTNSICRIKIKSREKPTLNHFYCYKLVYI